MDLNILEYITSILDSQNIQFNYLKAPYDNIAQIDYQFREKLGNPASYQTFLDLILTHCITNNIYIFHDSYFLFYAIIKLPESYLEYGEYMIISPILFHTGCNSTFLTESLDLSTAMQQLLLSFYQLVTRLPSEDHFKALITALFTPVLGDNIFTTYLDLSDSDHLLAIDDTPFLDPPDPDLSLIQNRYKRENALLDAVMDANYSKAILSYQKLKQSVIPPRVNNKVRNEKNLIITLNTLLRKSIEKRQIHPYYIDDLSRKFAIKIEGCTNLSQLNLISNEMIHKYCLLVKNHSLEKYSAIVKECILYIELHYMEPLTLEQITKLLNISNSYLSTLFRKEYGITITDFIYRTKLQHAIQLLNTSNLSIKEIAMNCGFDDINYFSRVFKKYQHQTASAYRKSIRSHSY